MGSIMKFWLLNNRFTFKKWNTGKKKHVLLDLFFCYYTSTESTYYCQFGNVPDLQSSTYGRKYHNLFKENVFNAHIRKINIHYLFLFNPHSAGRTYMCVCRTISCPAGRTYMCVCKLICISHVLNTKLFNWWLIFHVKVNELCSENKNPFLKKYWGFRWDI